MMFVSLSVAARGVWKFYLSQDSNFDLWAGSRVEWIHVFLEIEKGPSNFRCTSQHWFHNNWRNCDPMNILSQKWPNISYRCKKCLPIFGKGYSSDNNFVNCYGISAVTYTGNCSGLLQNDVKICKTKNGQKKEKMAQLKMAKNHFLRSVFGSWGGFLGVLGASLYWKVVSEFWFGHPKCHFWYPQNC